jgi:hypothetical protein
MALPANTVWEVRTTGAQTNGGGFCWTPLLVTRPNIYRWTASAGGTDEYYCEAGAGGDPSLTASGSVTLDGCYNLATEGTAGSLAAGEYDWADNDSLGFTTLYVRLTNGLDPDDMIARGQPGYVAYGVGGTDYSQQAAAQLSLTDIATDATGMTLTSTVGGFTSAMKNNIIFLTEGSATEGWYRVVGVTSTNIITIDRSAGADKTGVTGNVGGAFLFGGTRDDDFMEGGVSGNIYWVRGGTYTLGEAISSSKNGDAIYGLMQFVGYKTVRGDNPLGDDRPYFDNSGNAYYMQFGNIWLVANIRTLANCVAAALYVNQYALVMNCAAKNTGSHATRGLVKALSGNAQTVFVGCTAEVTKSHSALAVPTGGKAISCYTKGVKAGGYTSYCLELSAGAIAVDCVVDGGYYGIYSDNGSATALNCTAINCQYPHCWDTNSTTPCTLINCAVSDCTTGGYYKAETAGHHVAIGNCDPNGFVYGYSATFTPVYPVALGIPNLFVDPELADPTTADVSIDNDSPVYEKGVDVGYFTPATTYEE